VTPLSWHCYGEVRRVRRVGELTLVETEYAAAVTVPVHTHAGSSFCLALEGGFVECAGAMRLSSTVGAVLFHPGGEPHSRQFGAGISRCFTVDLGPELSRSLEARGLGGPDAVMVTQGRASWLAMRLYEEFSRGDAASSLAIEGLSLAVLAELTRVAVPATQDGATPPWLTAVLDLLDRRYLSPVRLAELAARVDMHPRHISRVFRQRLGVTLSDYVRRRRIDWASDRLVSTELPLSRIAMEAGFTDQAHFARLFKRATGLTPRAFRVARASVIATGLPDRPVASPAPRARATELAAAGRTRS
jgi:AraC family transcriptional regulator